MFLIVSWFISGAIFGSVGVAMVASALAKDGPRGDPNLDAIFLGLFLSTAIGAIGGGILAKRVRRRHESDKRTLDRYAIFPLLAAAVLIAYGVLK